MKKKKPARKPASAKTRFSAKAAIDQLARRLYVVEQAQSVYDGNQK